MFIRIRRKRKPRRISTDLYYDHKNNDFSVFCCCYCCCWCCCNFINEGELEMSNSVFFSLHSIQLSLLILLNFVLCSFCNCWTKRKIMYEDGFSFQNFFHHYWNLPIYGLQIKGLQMMCCFQWWLDFIRIFPVMSIECNEN